MREERRSLNQLGSAHADRTMSSDRDQALLSPSGTERLTSIDVLRTLSILMMIQIHFREYMAYGVPNVLSMYAARISLIFGRMPAPVFSFLVGLSLFLWMQKKKASGWSEEMMIKATVRRGLFLFTFGLGFLVFVWLPTWVFIWDILTFLGAATLFLVPVRKWSTGKLLMLALVLLIISPQLPPLTGYGTYWGGHGYNPAFTVREVVLGFFVHGYFPILPWLIFPVVGFAMGKEFSSFKAGDSKGNRRMLAIGFGFACLSGIVYFCKFDGLPFLEVYTKTGARFLMYPASTHYVTTMAATSCLGFWILNRRLDKGSAGSRGVVRSFFRRYSSFSLSAYVIHHIAFAPVMHIVAACQGKEDLRYYYNRVVSVPVALLLALLFVIVFYGILVIWEPKRKYSVEGLLRWLM